MHEPVFDRGSDWVQAQRVRYDTHYNTALGRAYVSGLLGDNEQLANDRYIAGKRFARTYNRVIGGETYRCALDCTPRGGLTEIEASEYDRRERDWLMDMMCSLDRAGVRPWLDQLLSRQYTDVGPYWLEALLAGGKHPADQRVLDAAVKALDMLCPPRRDIGIRSAIYEGAA